MSLLHHVSLERRYAIAHADKRRVVYDPEIISINPTGVWIPHNVIVMEDGTLELGKHFHPYREMFFTPTGGFDFRLVDVDAPENKRSIQLDAGSRIVIPPRIAHKWVAKKGSVIIGFGDVPFDPSLMMPYEGPW